jgi:translation initiation factor 4G
MSLHSPNRPRLEQCHHAPQSSHFFFSWFASSNDIVLKGSRNCDRFKVDRQEPSRREERQQKEEDERQRREDEQQRREDEQQRRVDEQQRQRREDERQQREDERQQREDERQQREDERLGTPTLSHATATPVHPQHPLPPISHPSMSMSSRVSSPLPTPSSASSRLNANEPLCINTSETLKKCPGRPDLSNTGSVPPSLPSALKTARYIDDINRVSYPEGIVSPNPELNANVKDGKFR